MSNELPSRTVIAREVGIDYIFPRDRTDIFPEEDDFYLLTGGDIPISLNNNPGDDYEALGPPANAAGPPTFGIFPIIITDSETGEVKGQINDYRDDWVKSILSNEPCEFIINVNSLKGGSFSSVSITNNSPGLQMEILEDSGARMSIRLKGIPTPFRGEFIDIYFKEGEKERIVRYLSTEIPRKIIEKRDIELLIINQAKTVLNDFLSTLSMKDLILSMNRNINVGIEKELAARYAVRILNMRKSYDELNPQIEELKIQYDSAINRLDNFLSSVLNKNLEILNQADIDDIKREILGQDRVNTFLPKRFGTPGDSDQEISVPEDPDFPLSETPQLDDIDTGESIDPDPRFIDPSGISLGIKRRNTYTFNFIHSFVVQSGEGDDITFAEVVEERSFIVKQNVIWYYDTLLEVFDQLGDRGTL